MSGNLLPKTPPDAPQPPRPSHQKTPGPGTPTPPTPIGTALPASMTTDQKNAYVTLQAMLQQYGLGSLAPQLLKIVQSGYTDSNAINYLLQQTPEWQKRFAGNAIRVKNGLAALNPADYLATENAYKDVFRNYGVPGGTFDTQDQLANFIGNDISATELNDRVKIAQSAVQNVDPNIRAAFKSYYGVDDGHLMSYFLDPKKGEQVLTNQANAASIGSAALDQGLALTNADQAMKYAQAGITADQAKQAYGTAAAILPEESRIAERFGQSYTQQDAENELLGGLASAQRKRQLLNQRETGLFAGGGGAGDTFYHPDYGVASEVGGQF